jgi:hypothetical protein
MSRFIHRENDHEIQSWKLQDSEDILRRDFSINSVREEESTRSVRVSATRRITQFRSSHNQIRCDSLSDKVVTISLRSQSWSSRRDQSCYLIFIWDKKSSNKILRRTILEHVLDRKRCSIRRRRELSKELRRIFLQLIWRINKLKSCQADHNHYIKHRDRASSTVSSSQENNLMKTIFRINSIWFHEKIDHTLR